MIKKTSKPNAWILLALAISLIVFIPSASAQQFGGANRARTGGARGGGAGSSSSRDYYSNGTVGEALVTSDPDSRRLIVITDEETSHFVSQVVTNLDQPRPQVLINVVFLEVTYNNNFDFGIESSYGHQIDSNTRFGGTNMFSGLVPTPNNGFSGLAQEGAANAFGVPGAGVYQIAGQDFAVTLRAIAANGKLEVLSRPTILARNNQQAYILVGQQVPLISNVRFDQVGNQINTVTYQDVGIILRVTPFITSEGYVEMIVAPEISSLDRSQSIPISPGVVAPVINKRSADTVVLTPDGQSIVIGGLMENNKSETVSKVPFLGDIPGIGQLFKRTQKNGTKTELLIFLTPHVVRSPNQLADLSSKEANRPVNAPNSFSEDELNRFLETVPFKQTNPPKKEKNGN
jgi:general secretion pathway protein D